MKGFGRILMLAFLMVATLGHAKQSLAQPGSADAFNSRMPISGASGYDSGSNLGASKEIGEPNHAGNSGGASVWWTWAAPMSDEVTFNTQGSDFDTLLAVYTGESLNRLKAVGSNDDTGGTLQSEVRFVAQQGQTYHVAVDGYGGATGAIVLNWQTPSTQPLNAVNGVSTTVDNQILVELFPEDHHRAQSVRSGRVDTALHTGRPRRVRARGPKPRMGSGHRRCGCGRGCDHAG